MWSQKISRFLIAVKRELFQQKLVYVLLLLRLLSGADHGRKTTKIYDSCITDKPHFLKDELNVDNNSSNIPVIIISNRCHISDSRKHNALYNRQLIPILRQDINNTNDNRNYSWLPSFYLINARSLLAKVDELQALLHSKPVDIIAITESWLHDDISYDLIAVNGFTIYKNDRSH